MAIEKSQFESEDSKSICGRLEVAIDVISGGDVARVQANCEAGRSVFGAPGSGYGRSGPYRHQRAGGRYERFGEYDDDDTNSGYGKIW